LWISCKNPFAQDFDRNKLERAFNKLELVVSVEQFFTETVKHSDIVLPVTTLFEEWTVNVSYWHYWLSLNEQAIKPMYETRSNIEIAAALSRAMNRKEPGSCTFPQEVDGKEWMIKECNKGIYDLFGISGWEDLRKGPAKAKRASSAAWPEKTFKTPSGKYEFRSDLCAKNGFKALPEFVEGRKPTGPFRLLTPHVQFALHSQFVNLDWMETFYPEPFVYIHPEAAKERGIRDTDMVRVANATGEVRLRARLTTNVAKDCLVMYEAWFRKLSFNVQNLVDDCQADMGAMKTGAPGVAIHDQFVDVMPVNGGRA
jgi:anaerobic selenocysteine-containing dehydrogenase